MDRILVIRGGAIGDFILTLPALKSLRNAYPDARLELLAYKHIAALADQRFYANATRSIEYGPLSGFFARGSELNPELRDYFGSFNLIISYLFDPDGIFESNLRRCGAKNIVTGPGKIDPHSHAVRQLMRPVEELGLIVDQVAPKIYPSLEDREFAREFLRDLTHPIIAIHPGSGSETKDWPIENWVKLGNGLLEESASRSGGFQAADFDKRRPGERRSLMITGGEADENQLQKLESEWRSNPRVRFAKNLSLPQLAAVIEHTFFIGHDSGISHLAAAVGAKCVLLFGPTDPVVWAPLNQDVEVIGLQPG